MVDGGEAGPDRLVVRGDVLPAVRGDRPAHRLDGGVEADEPSDADVRAGHHHRPHELVSEVDRDLGGGNTENPVTAVVRRLLEGRRVYTREAPAARLQR